MCADSPTPPPAPDYIGAANATSAGNIDAARVAAQANRVNQYTPYGNLVYSQIDPSNPDRWRSDISLSPTGQALLDTGNQSALGIGALQNQQLGRVSDTYNKGPDLQSVQDTADKAYSNYTSRLDPQWKHQQEMTENQLTNQGLRPGTEAYDNAMRGFNNAKNDAYTQANTAAINTMPQTYQLSQAQYDQPLNELNALRTGSQVTSPNFNNSVPQQQSTPGGNYLAAAQGSGQYSQGIYGSQVASTNAQNAATGQAAGAVIGAAAMFF